MGLPAVGRVVLVPFPFSDLSQTKVRPAVCLADASALIATDFADGGLLLESFARPGKLFTAHDTQFVRVVGTLTDEALSKLLAVVVSQFGKTR